MHVKRNTVSSLGRPAYLGQAPLALAARSRQPNFTPVASVRQLLFPQLRASGNRPSTQLRASGNCYSTRPYLSVIIFCCLEMCPGGGMADASVSKTDIERCVGSNPTPGTTSQTTRHVRVLLYVATCQVASAFAAVLCIAKAQAAT